MLIKEYRIPLPMTLEEYRIAQLFMIQKKSRLESSGSDSAVEIIENAPYEEGPGGAGQYTKKIYHIGSHLPGWLLSLLPKTALRVEETSWNAYPYTKTRFSCPFIDKFFIDIETFYLPDHGQTENVFKLSVAERKRIEVDIIDPIKDPFPPKEYKEEEDPHSYVSKKTGRGPLTNEWLENIINESGESCDVMCAYKLIKVEFKYWGMQGKIENFIHNGLRNPMLVGHRQAWSWQDEWFGLTIEDIRLLEKQAQLELSRRLEGESSGELGDAPESDDQKSAEDTVTASPMKTGPDETRVEFSQGNYLTSEEQTLGMHMKHIEQSESDDDDFDEDAFFDALETLDDVSLSNIKEARRRSSAYSSFSSVYGSTFITMSDCCEEEKQEELKVEEPVHYDTHALILVIQAGSIADYETDHESKDFKMFKEIILDASDKCYPGSRQMISIELVTATSLSMEIMEELKNLHFSSQPGRCDGSEDSKEHISNSFPFSLVPLLIMQNHMFQDAVNDLVKAMNHKYRQLENATKTDEKNLEVFVIADCIGGILLYNVLTQTHMSDITSICEEHIDEYNTLLLDFIISGIFFLGSPVGLVAFNEKISSGKDPTRPHCGQIYNLFHPLDPLCFRIEPIIDTKFKDISPMTVPRHQGFPFCFDLQVPTSIRGAISMTSMYSGDDDVSLFGDDDFTKKDSVSSLSIEKRKAAYISQSFDSQWWGTKRIDYSLCCPQGLHQFPVSALVHLCYNSYWESKDLATFILWQILNEKYSKSNSLTFYEVDGITNMQPAGKWLKRRTALKIKNMGPTHRGNDAISACGVQPVITGKFAYGPVAMVALSGETIDVYLKHSSQISEWELLGSEITDSHGRLVFTLPRGNLEPGVYSVKLVVRGDHSSTDCNMAIVAPQTEAVVFSVDSSFLASISLSGINPKIRGGAVDAVRHWQELGYFIIYVSSRLLFQKYQVMSWLSEHKFPFGIVSFCATVSTNYQKHKINFLRNVSRSENISIHAAYGSSRDIPVYISALNLPPQKVFLLGKKSKMKKLDYGQWITSGYAAHLNELKTNPLSVRSSNNILLSVGNFGIMPKRMSSKKKGGGGVEGGDDFPNNKSLVRKETSEGEGSRHHLPLKGFGLRKTKSNPSNS